MNRIGLALLGTTLALGGCATAPAARPAPAPEPASPARTVDSLMSAYGASAPGAAVLVFRGDEQLFAKGYGRADLEHADPITPRTVFHVASVSKQFTAFAIATLAAQGRLSLDDDVRRHLPELPDFGQTITLRHLLHHTSGLRDQWTLWVLAGGLPDDVIRQDDLMRLITRQRELNFAPGTAWTYSNTGYTLLAEVVERVTGQDFGAWMKANVFTPLGMSDTQVYDDHERLVPGRAYSYRAAGEGWEKAVLSYANSGATSLFTTTEDLARWLRNLGSGRVGGAPVGEMMRQRGMLADGDTLDYALGIFSEKYRGLDMLYHGGADAGFRSQAVYFPALDAGVVVLANVAGIDTEEVARRTADAFFSAEMQPLPARPQPSAEVEPAVAVDSALLERYTGDWQLEGGPMLRFQREGERLFMLQGTRRGELRAVADSVFLLSEAGIRITFHREDAAQVSRGTVLQRGRATPLGRITYAPSADELRAYTGRYYSPELEAVYTVVLQDGKLLARHRRHGDVALTPRQENVFQGAESFLASVRFERDSAGAVTGLHVSSSSDRMRNVWFQKLD